MLISVVVATYNRPDALAAVLRSLGKQDDHQFEVVVADDGSGQRHRSASSSGCKRRSRCRCRTSGRKTRGSGLAAARNRATARARGEYLIYLDGDCIVAATLCAPTVIWRKPAGA